MPIAMRNTSTEREPGNNIYRNENPLTSTQLGAASRMLLDAFEKSIKLYPTGGEDSLTLRPYLNVTVLRYTGRIGQVTIRSHKEAKACQISIAGNKNFGDQLNTPLAMQLAAIGLREFQTGVDQTTDTNPEYERLRLMYPNTENLFKL